LEVCVQVASGATSGKGMVMAGAIAPGTVMTAAPTITYSAPSVLGHSCYASNPMTYSSFPTAQPMVYGAPQPTSMPMMSQPSMTYSAPGAHAAAKVKQVIVHAPVTVTAEEFARTNGTIVSTPLPVTIPAESAETTVERSIEKVKKKRLGCC